MSCTLSAKVVAIRRIWAISTPIADFVRRQLLKPEEDILRLLIQISFKLNNYSCSEFFSILRLRINISSTTPMITTTPAAIN
jgi:hypothetical protein